MPKCLCVGGAAQGHAWKIMLENLGEDWLCDTLQDAQKACAACAEDGVALAVACADGEGERFLRLMKERPPLSPPWLVSERPCDWADAVLLVQDAERVLECMTAWTQGGRMPRLALERHAQMVCLARGLMTTLNVPRHLRAWAFLPDMLALAAVHPALMEDLRGRLYPLIARRHGLTAAAVERRLRLAIESTWNGASLQALERFFGHSVDPERGKPTNREFLFRVQERLLLAGRRIA